MVAVPLVADVIVARPQQTDPVSQSTAPRQEKAAVRLGHVWLWGMQVLRFGSSLRQQVLVLRLQLSVLPHACGPPSYGGGGGGASSEASAPEPEPDELDPELEPDDGWPPLLLDEPLLLGWLPELLVAVPLLLVVPPLPLPLPLELPPVLEPEPDDELVSSPWKPDPPLFPHAANEKAAPTPTSNTAKANGRGVIRCSKARRLYLEWMLPGRTGIF